jgi:hypothetical protein
MRRPYGLGTAALWMQKNRISLRPVCGAVPQFFSMISLANVELLLNPIWRHALAPPHVHLIRRVAITLGGAPAVRVEHAPAT